MYLSPFPMLLLKGHCMSTSVWKSVTNPQLLVCRLRSQQRVRSWWILEEVKITHFEPVYVQWIKLHETSWTTRNVKTLNNFASFLKLKLILMFIITILFFLYQNVRITELLIMHTERLRIEVISTVIVTMESDLVGFVSKRPPVKWCQRHANLHTDVALMHPRG